MNISEQVKCQCGVRAASECRGAWEPGCDLGANPDHVAVADETPEQVIASLTTAPEEPGFVRIPRTAEEARSMVAVGNLWLLANSPKPIDGLDEFLAYAEANGIKTIHDLPGLIPALQATEPVAERPVGIHQWRKCGTSMWWDGLPDRTDGCGPYETRTLYAGAAPVQAASQAVKA